MGSQREVEERAWELQDVTGMPTVSSAPCPIASD